MVAYIWLLENTVSDSSVFAEKNSHRERKNCLTGFHVVFSASSHDLRHSSLSSASIDIKLYVVAVLSDILSFERRKASFECWWS